jgi:pilus assembly protein HofN
MRDALGRVDGFSPGTVGALQQDKQGRWAFTFQLKHQG